MSNRSQNQSNSVFDANNGRITIPFGDSAVLIRFGDGIAPEINRRVHAMAKAISQAAITGVIEVCPAYTELAVHFDPMAICYDELITRLEGLETCDLEQSRRIIAIPVSYGGADGPDLAEVARMTGLTAREVVDIHAQQIYEVYMIGFLPGFPYLGLVPPAIAVPRLAQPRLKVPRGSVGLAGRQTGIYPCEAPGGWRLIGRTNVLMFDPQRAQPCYLQPGDRVRFEPI
ncbi:MAG TPA: allophanate hydrolase [Firmicutes bacterium]|jgi:KipI family sensor histidine kinase inhibitor|nr:allophanate hydrolase [Bacillota bacterium]HBG44025.1 allophanate hydrolase [Bacillota bacterium]HBL67600.1 allophanate hydrolase [Bacillota bacterium]